MQGINDQSCSPNRVSLTIAHSKVDIVIFAIVEDVARIVDITYVFLGSKKNEDVLFPINYE